MKPEPLTIEDVTGGNSGERILRLKGPLLISNLFEFQAKVREDESRSLILDFTNVPYIDSAGIGALVGCYVSRQKDSGRSLTLTGVNQRVRNSLHITRVEQFFQFDNVAAAS
jgi:anti-sigma B factor antagonist